MIDDRSAFAESWLSEMPMGKKTPDAYLQVLTNIRDAIDSGAKPIELGDGLYKIEGSTVLYYWYQDKTGTVLLASQLSKRGDTVSVNITAKKNPGQPPYADDLYVAILDDRRKTGNIPAVRLHSDNILSPDAFGTWKRLLSAGHKIMAYDRENPTDGIRKIGDLDDLSSFFGMDDASLRRYEYVLVESDTLWEMVSIFSLHRYRKLAGIL